MPSRLKSLELQGYKTFASRTVFEFAESVTAIVGPNGSGKSNIADALRWVLGEQSYSLLRGKKTEDMIFSGSEHRPRAGMASATVTFDNSDGWLPIDYAEVAISRRAYRDGQNEYVLNGQRVRLRDVSELLAQSGLAERTYTIIGQGLVDAALALKAEERRRLFEEAAGIGLHRSRREEALRRLESTERNLDRVQDILAELQPRLRSLERQARRAREYEQVKADLKVVLREWYGYHWHRAQTELSGVNEIARSQEVSLKAARQVQEELDERLRTLRGEIQNVRNDLNTWHRQIALLHAERETVGRKLAVAEERLRSLENQKQSFQTDLASMDGEIAMNFDRLETARAEWDRLQKEQEVARDELDVAKESLERRVQERERFSGKLQKAREGYARLTARQSEISARLAEQKSQAGRRREAAADADRKTREAEQSVGRARVRMHASDEALLDAALARDEIASALAAQRENISEAERSLLELVRERDAREVETARLLARLEVLEEAEKSLVGYSKGAQVLLQAIRDQRLGGGIGALGKLLEIPEHMETAIGAALGDFIDGIVIQDESDLAVSLEILSGKPGRAALLPLKEISELLQRPFNRFESLDEYGEASGEIIGIASDLVGAPEELMPSIRLLLGNAIIVRDRETARKIIERWRAGNLANQDLRVVTLEGEIFYIHGPVVIGKEERSGVIGRMRQQRELSAQVEEIRVQATGLDQKKRELESRLAELKESEEVLNENLESAEKTVEQAREEHRENELTHGQLLRQYQWQESQRENLLIEIESGEQEITVLAESLVEIESELAHVKKEVRSQQLALADYPLDEFQAQVAHWETRFAVMERALTDASSRMEERQATLENSRKRGADFQDKLEGLEKTKVELGSERSRLQKVEGELARQIDLLRARIGPAEKKLDQANANQDELQAAEAEARQALSAAEHHHAQAKINLARRQESMDTLRRRIEDDFGLVAFEYAEEVSGPTPLPFDGLVEELPRVHHLSPEVEETLKRQRAQLRRIGAINPEAQAEYREVKQRFEFLNEQMSDLHKAETDIRQVIAELDDLMERKFQETFILVAEEFRKIFHRLFGGGSARLVLTNPDDLTDTGIDVEARLPGRREQGLTLLSGGERSLTAVALVFALLRVSPTPFCVLDEVDAMLDEANVGRFRDLLRELSGSTQFIIITHNRNTVQVADVIYGVTMGRDSTSQLLSLKLDEVAEVVA